MPIDPICLARLQQIGLPMVVEVRNRHGAQLTTAEIHANGEITDQATGITYGCPSALRQAIVYRNTATYRFLFLNGNSLESMGVHR